ncbi:MAG: 50S ribosomal protein L15 [Bdellovibrionales bacterium]|nr:50S ribosomal protein L15 [Bdellovibrionales bacterium]
MLDQLKPAPGSTHYRKRVGRGDGSGHGGTAGKGHKGQKARTGGRVRRGFEGGQTPLVRRLPKFGFTNNQFKTEYVILNLSDFSRYGSEISPDVLVKAGVMGKNCLLKVLGNGKLEKPVTVKAHKFSGKAKEMIEKAGGKTEVI